ncbi:MAG: PcfJ domain-containing protein [Anaerolineaceae bacterium]|nr:PcfJ domain-containing protein [Anaerolineaceae bacterium]
MIKTNNISFQDADEVDSYIQTNEKEFFRSMYGNDFYIRSFGGFMRIFVDPPDDNGIESLEDTRKAKPTPVFSCDLRGWESSSYKMLSVCYGMINDKNLYFGTYYFEIIPIMPKDRDRYYFPHDYYISKLLYVDGMYCFEPYSLYKKTLIPNNKLNIINADAKEQAQKDYPYAASIISETDIPVELFYTFPEIELLYKAGYQNICRQISEAYIKNDQKNIERLNTFLNHGKDPKSIFGVSKDFCEIIRDNNLSVLTLIEIKKFKNQFKCPMDLIMRYVDAGIFEKSTHFQRIKRILKFKHNGKAVYTPETLINYLNRTYMYEALEYNDALISLDDYLQSCKILRIEPNCDSDSLLREHNIAARLVREKIAEEDRQSNLKMSQVCEFWQKLDWNNGRFFIRSIRNITDLIEESRMQRNCVASYRDRIINGSSAIFVMRNCASPEKSLITVELFPRTGQVVQALLGANQQIEDFGQKQFLQEWSDAISEGRTDDWEILPKDLNYDDKCKYQDEMYIKISAGQES